MTRYLKPLAVIVLLTCYATTTVQAQSIAREFVGWGQGMMGPGMMGGFGYGRMCGPYAAGFADWRTERLERSLKLNDSQREPFAALRKASSDASEILRDSCPRELTKDAPSRAKAMEERMDMMLRAVRTVRPALDAFYATLSDEQKAIFDGHGYWPRKGRR
jgi:hypothetical protein